jgi:outer membrane protein assembly factor BamB
VSALNGKLVWTRDIRRDAGAQEPQWGFAGSALIQGNLSLYNVGTAGVALEKANGKPVWISGAGMAGYSSPVPFSQGNRRGVALFVSYGVVAVDPENGKPLWESRWQTNFGVNAADPIVTGDSVFISSNYGHGCALLKVTGNKMQSSWENRSMKNHFNSCVLVNGAYFGNDEGRLRCLDARTGAERWSQKGSMGKGGLICADGKLIVITERGELLVVNASSDRYTELASAQVMRGTCWTHPVLANGFIYCRSHEGELVCLDVRGK